jgi:hypothetical protein
LGGLWLAANLGLTPRVGWITLLQLWPLLLIAVGVDLLLARRSAIFGALVALITIGIAVGLAVTTPSLGLGQVPQARTDILTEPIAAATSAQIDLDLSVGPTSISVLEDPNLLLRAEITHLGELDFDVRGEDQKYLSLGEHGLETGLNWLNFFDQDQELAWQIELTPHLPLGLYVHGGVGDADLELDALILTEFGLDGGVGDISVDLPPSADGLHVRLNGGVGSLSVSIQPDSEVEITIEGGVGDITVVLPEQMAARIEADTGVGQLRLPARFMQVEGDQDQLIGQTGVWQTAGYEIADTRILIHFTGGVGDFIIR